MLTIIVRILRCKLRTRSWPIYHLRIVIVPLSIDLMSDLLIHSCRLCLIGMSDCLDHFLASRNQLAVCILIFERFDILISWCHNSFFGICWAYVIIRVSFSTGDSVPGTSLILIGKLYHLLWILITLQHHLGMLCFSGLCPIFVKWYVDSTVLITYNRKNLKLEWIFQKMHKKYEKLLTSRFFWNPFSDVILL